MNIRPIVLVADPLSPVALASLGSDVEVRHCDGTNRPALLAAVENADALLVRSATRVDAEVLDAASRLRFIGRAGVGLDNVDVQGAALRGIAVVNAPTANVVSAAEMTCALILASARRLLSAGSALRQGSWERSRYTGVELSGKTLGVIGLGRIGTLVAERMAAFGMDIVAHDPHLGGGAPDGVELLALEELLRRADVITVHLPKNAETIGLIGRAELAAMKPTALLVNVARGGIVDEQALHAALVSGGIAGAALDVFGLEPCTESPLFELDNVTPTPHLGASTSEAQDRAGVTVVEAALKALLDQPAGGLAA
ncbi:hydroxyacid dehydrogenase [Streptomyces paradoxus]|uniref:hydroxyacid dehydrogenase n=1 Tax=Streptomyces paradoxus TaxID=66375 RepID=UPI0037CD7D4A